MQLEKDQVITNKLHYDMLLKAADELKVERKSKKIELQVYQGNYNYHMPRDSKFPTYSLTLQIGEKVPKEIFDDLATITKTINYTDSVIKEMMHNNKKLIDEKITLIREYDKKLSQVPAWKRWILNIKL